VNEAARPRLRAHARLRRDGEALLLVGPERALRLNESAARVVALLDGTRTLAELAAALGAPPADLTSFLEALRLRGLVADAPDDADDDAPALAPVAAPRRDSVNQQDHPYTLIAELTWSCPLRCAYCANPTDQPAPAALSTAIWIRTLREAAALGVVQAHLTGGEPLLRRDLEALVAAARAADLYVSLITSGLPLDRARLARLRAAGLDHLQLSLQSTRRARAAAIAGRDVLDDKLAVARWAKELGLPLTLNLVLHRHNLDEIEEAAALAERLGADRLELANAQYLGSAHLHRDALLPSATQIARARAAAAVARRRLAGRVEVVFVMPDLHSGQPRACMGGWARRYIVVAPDGRVLPCHAALAIRDLAFERIVERPLADIWAHSPALAAFRGEAWMEEPCRSCERRAEDFGGCRCQAFLLTGRATATDPACARAPDHALVRAARDAAAAAPRSSTEPPSSIAPLRRRMRVVS
jgi:pyrroloquinoline quinone biosynthesis protein E